MNYPLSDRGQIAELSKGKIIDAMEWDDVECYWVMTFTDGTELCVRLMSDEIRLGRA